MICIYLAVRIIAKKYFPKPVFQLHNILFILKFYHNYMDLTNPNIAQYYATFQKVSYRYMSGSSTGSSTIPKRFAHFYKEIVSNQSYIGDIPASSRQ